MDNSFDLPTLPEPFVSLKTAQFAIGENVTSGLFTADQMQAYARAAIEAEREACAKLCDQAAPACDEYSDSSEFTARRVAKECATKIRARGKS